MMQEADTRTVTSKARTRAELEKDYQDWLAMGNTVTELPAFEYKPYETQPLGPLSEY